MTVPPQSFKVLKLSVCVLQSTIQCSHRKRTHVCNIASVFRTKQEKQFILSTVGEAISYQIHHYGNRYDCGRRHFPAYVNSFHVSEQKSVWVTVWEGYLEPVLIKFAMRPLSYDVAGVFCKVRSLRNRLLTVTLCVRLQISAANIYIQIIPIYLFLMLFPLHGRDYSFSKSIPLSFFNLRFIFII